MPQIVFSMLHAESIEVLTTCMSNFLLFAKEPDLLVINTTNPDALKLKTESPKIFINQGQPRKAHGSDLLNAHIENWKFVCNLLKKSKEDFLFSTTASNSLFFRGYDKDAIVKSMSVPVNKPISEHSGWQYNAIKKSPSFLKSFGELYIHNQIEGFTTWSSSWKSISNAVDRLNYPSHKLEKDICLEEVLPLSVLALQKLPSTNICSMKWRQSRQGARFVTVGDLFVTNHSLPGHHCQYKWFDRNPSSVTTMAVSNKELNKTLSDVFGYANASDSVTKFQLASAFLNQLSIPQAKLDLGDCSFSRSVSEKLSRKVLRLNEGLTTAPFVYFESIPEGFSSELSIQISNTTATVISKSDTGTMTINADAYRDLKFYAVLYLPVPNDATDLYLTDFEYAFTNRDEQHRCFNNQEMLLNFGVLEESGKYEVVTPDYNSFGSQFLRPFTHFALRPPKKNHHRCFGVPIIANSGFRFSVRLNTKG